MPFVAKPGGLGEKFLFPLWDGPSKHRACYQFAKVTLPRRGSTFLVNSFLSGGDSSFARIEPGKDFRHPARRRQSARRLDVHAWIEFREIDAANFGMGRNAARRREKVTCRNSTRSGTRRGRQLC